MRRKLFTVCSARSLMLSAAACALWVRCYVGLHAPDVVLTTGTKL